MSPPNAVIISACDEAAPTYSPPNQETEVNSEWPPLCSPGGIHHSVGTKSPTDVIIVPDSGHASKRTSTSSVSYGLITPTGALPSRTDGNIDRTGQPIPVIISSRANKPYTDDQGFQTSRRRKKTVLNRGVHNPRLFRLGDGYGKFTGANCNEHS
ncbi:hypothetical protein DPMN_191412 [Dreissena polymorpha]|uniref:Uncharacterized protein n=1 Tax=Dreissena polymorpha TaxID=45954 RepID=A0A9D4BEC3_DREPO|nr:hypothetical protein DPMN_191412 [Dreissena polymorpha]